MHEQPSVPEEVNGPEVPLQFVLMGNFLFCPGTQMAQHQRLSSTLPIQSAMIEFSPLFLIGTIASLKLSMGLLVIWDRTTSVLLKMPHTIDVKPKALPVIRLEHDSWLCELVDRVQSSSPPF